MTTFKKVNLNPKSFFETHNNVFNRQLSPIIDDFFSPVIASDDDYIPIYKIRVDEIKNYSPITERDNALKSTEYNNNIFIEPVYENMLMNLMLDANHTTWVLAGGMGSGKSSTCNYVVNKLKYFFNEKHHFFKTFDFDFNTLNPSDDENKIEIFFTRLLIKKLKYNLHNYFKENFQAFKSLTNEIKSVNIEEFYEFRRIMNSTGWNLYSENQKIDSFFDYLTKNFEETLSNFLDLLSRLKQLNSNLHFLIILDNIDSLKPSNQRTIFSTMLRYNSKANIKVFIPLRRATFIRNKKMIQKMTSNGSAAAYHYGYVHHHGVKPSEVVKKRISDISALPEKYESKIPLEYRNIFKKRLHNIDEFLNDEKSLFLSLFIDAICGRSSRLAMSLMKRLFINNVTKYDEDLAYQDLAIKALMIGTNSNYLFNNSNPEELIYNIFTSETDSFSFIPFFILIFIEDNKFSDSRSIKNAYHYIREVFKDVDTVNEVEFFKALNDLLNVRRPLLWADDKAYYEVVSLSNDDWDNLLHLTELGDGYINICLKNTQYIQECFTSLYWSHEYVPDLFESNTIVSRFKFLRNCIQEVFASEKTLLNKDNYFNQLSVDIFASISTSFSSILSSRKSKSGSFNFEERNELLNYQSLMISLQNYFDIDISSSNQINRIINSFEKP